MSEIKHTPPELEAEGPYVVAIRGSVSYQVADCTISQHGEAYARLFAASQKMRAALLEYLIEVPIDEVFDHAEKCKSMARDSLAAAEGRTEEKEG